MTKQEIAKEAFERKLETYKKYQQFKDKEELDKQTEHIIMQIKNAEQVKLINEVMANEYLAELKRNYTAHIHSEQFKEWREQVINFNDDFITSRERLFAMRDEEKKSLNTREKFAFSLNDWKRELDRNGASTNASGNNEREEITHDKQEEREEEKTKDI